MSLARSAVNRPLLWLALVAAATLALGAGMLRLELHTEGGALHPSGNPVVDASEADRLRFEEPRQLVVLVSCRPPSAPACLAAPEGLRFLRRIHDGLEAHPAVRGSGVQSLAGLLHVTLDGGSLAIERHLDEIPDAPVAFRALLDDVRAHPLTDGLLLSHDGGFASLSVPLVEHRRVPELVAELEQWRQVREREDPGYKLRLTGPLVAEATLGHMVLRDLAALIPVMLVVVSLLLFLTFGNGAGVLIPMLESGMVLVWTFGAMGWLGVPITLVTTILPVVLMAMAIADEIHLLERVRGQPAHLPRRDAVLAALAEVGRPIVATSVTTALGFLSFLSASVPPLRDFGAFTAFGILVAMALTFCWVPALIVVLPPSWLERSERARLVLPGLGLERLARWATRRPTPALGVGLALLVASLPGLLLLRVQDSWVGNFDPESELVRAERDFNNAFWGSYRFDVIFEGVPDFFYSSRGAAVIESFSALAETAPHVGGVESHLTSLGEVARAMGEEPPLSRLPEMAVADLAVLAEMSDERMNLRRLLTDAGDATRARLYVNSPDYAMAEALHADLEARLPALALPDFVNVHFSGDLPVALELVREIVRNQLRSIGWALLSVTLVLVLFFARGRAGLIAMVPVTAATACLLGGMGLLGVPLGIATSMFASLTVGVGVDFGIHFLHRYREERRRGEDDAGALRATLEKAGVALRWNALVLALGFAVLAVSSLKPNHSLGLLLAAAMLACYVATLLFLPRLARLAPVLLAIALATGGGAGAARADAALCPAPADAAALAVMAKIEHGLRSGTRVAHMTIRRHYPEGHPLALYNAAHPEIKTLWGVFSSDERETWTLYVFSGPGRLAGTSLLMRDSMASLEGDRMWLYLRAFESFNRLESTARRRTLVPGTDLTYEDSRGFVPTDKYEFSFLAAGGSGNALREVLACPRTQQIAEDLGYGQLRLSVDVAKHLVRRIDYRDHEGRPLKEYRLESERRVGSLWLPQAILLVHTANGTTTPIEYEHWLPEQAPPRSLFEPSVEAGGFRARMERYLVSIGLGDRIRPELEAADRSVREWEERWGAESR